MKVNYVNQTPFYNLSDGAFVFLPHFLRLIKIIYVKAFMESGGKLSYIPGLGASGKVYFTASLHRGTKWTAGMLL